MVNKEERDEKLVAWLQMDDDEKRKYNGWNGFLNGELFKDHNAFSDEDNAKLKRRREREKQLLIRFIYFPNKMSSLNLTSTCFSTNLGL